MVDSVGRIISVKKTEHWGDEMKLLELWYFRRSSARLARSTPPLIDNIRELRSAATVQVGTQYFPSSVDHAGFIHE